jgi:glucosylceramidase
VGSSFAGDLAWNAENLLIGATRNWARSVSLWNLALDQNSGPKNGGCPNCRGVVTIDYSVSPPAITNNVEYYVLGHLAKFLVPGAYRIDSNSFGHGGIEDVAFQNPDGSIVVLVLNSGSNNTSFAVNWKGQFFTYSLPAGAVATFQWK